MFRVIYIDEQHWDDLKRIIMNHGGSFTWNPNIPSIEWNSLIFTPRVNKQEAESIVHRLDDLSSRLQKLEDSVIVIRKGYQPNVKYCPLCSHGVKTYMRDGKFVHFTGSNPEYVRCVGKNE